MSTKLKSSPWTSDGGGSFIQCTQCTNEGPTTGGVFFRAAWRRVPVCPKWFIRKPLIDGYVRDKHSIFSPTDALFYCGNNIISLTWKNKHPIFHVESENRVPHSIHWLINMFFHFSINYENNHFHPIFVMLPVISESQHVLTYLRAWWCNIRICSLFTPLWSLYIYIHT